MKMLNDAVGINAKKMLTMWPLSIPFILNQLAFKVCKVYSSYFMTVGKIGKTTGINN